VGHLLDWDRLHFLGQVPYESYQQIIQISSCHIYLTMPFVLSWSMLEAMSAGCAIVASDVEPVREIAEHDEAALMLTALSPAAIAQNVIDVLSAPMRRKKQGEAARRVIEKHYSVGSIFDQKISLLKSV
ncbi:MAG: glycosyltransferase, partial [Pseudomonadota bacterium]